MSWVGLIIAVLVLIQVLDVGTISYEFGGWPPPWGIELRLDVLNALIVLIVAGVGAVVMPFAGPSAATEIGENKHPLYFCLFLLVYTGLLGIAVTGDIFQHVRVPRDFVALELRPDRSRPRQARTDGGLPVPAHGHDRGDVFPDRRGLMYSLTGTLNIADLAERLPAVSSTRTAHTAFAFLVAGVGLKLALYPVHLWLPNSYTYAPSAVSAFIAATATKVAVYLLLRVLFTVFGADYSFDYMPLAPILIGLSVIGIIATSISALMQSNAKRLLAYSSVAQVGYMVVGMAIGTVAGLTASITHIFNHAVMKGGLFLALGAVAYRIGSTRINDMAGLGRAMPWTMSAFAIGGLSLIGVPLTSGFISKWYLILAALEQGWWWLALIVLATSLIAVMYVWKVVEAAWFRELPEGNAEVAEAPLRLLVPLWLITAANIWFGVDTRWSAGIASRAAEMLLGMTP